MYRGYSVRLQNSSYINSFICIFGKRTEMINWDIFTRISPGTGHWTGPVTTTTNLLKAAAIRSSPSVPQCSTIIIWLAPYLAWSPSLSHSSVDTSHDPIKVSVITGATSQSELLSCRRETWKLNTTRHQLDVLLDLLSLIGSPEQMERHWETVWDSETHVTLRRTKLHVSNCQFFLVWNLLWETLILVRDVMSGQLPVWESGVGWTVKF